jgi:hypothetical protein
LAVFAWASTKLDEDEVKVERAETNATGSPAAGQFENVFASASKLTRPISPLSYELYY